MFEVSSCNDISNVARVITGLSNKTAVTVVEPTGTGPFPAYWATLHMLPLMIDLSKAFKTGAAAGNHHIGSIHVAEAAKEAWSSRMRFCRGNGAPGRAFRQSP